MSRLCIEAKNSQELLPTEDIIIMKRALFIENIKIPLNNKVKTTDNEIIFILYAIINLLIITNVGSL